MICSVVTQTTFGLLLKSCLYYSLCNLEWLTSAVKCSLKGFSLCKQILPSDLMKCCSIPKCLLLWLLRMSSYPCLNKLTYFVKEELLLAYVWVCAWGAESPPSPARTRLLKRLLQWQTARIFFALNSNLPLIYLYMLTPQFNLSVLPGGHRDAKWGPSQAVRDVRWKHCRQNFIYESHNRARWEIKTWKRVSGPRKVAGFARGWDFSWWRLECKALVCVLLSSLFLWHTFDL